VVAGVGTVAGLSLTWLGATAYARASMTLTADPVAVLLSALGILLLGVAALSLAIHWVGVLVVGAIHALLGLLALVVPLGNPFGGGIFSPVFQITGMLTSLDQTLGDGSRVFFFSGTALVIGAFLVGAALGVRSRRLAGPSRPKAVAVSSGLGAVSLLAATALLVVAGGTFVRAILVIFKYDATLAALTVTGGVLAGLAGLLLRWSSIGVLIAGGLVLGAGIAFFAAPSVMPGSPGDLIWGYGLAMVAGVTFVAAAAGGTLRGRDEVPAGADAL
jgi:hypothetical protein